MNTRSLTKVINFTQWMWVRYTLGLLAVLFIATIAHCSVAQQARPQGNSLGFQPYYENPNEYLFASVSGVKVVRDSKESLYTYVLFQPAHTYSLFNTAVLFCGNVSGIFKRGALVITYERVAHKRFNGDACHELISVNNVKEETIQ